MFARYARTTLWGVKTKEVYSYENELSTSGPLRISLIEMPDQVGHDVWYGDNDVTYRCRKLDKLIIKEFSFMMPKYFSTTMQSIDI